MPTSCPQRPTRTRTQALSLALIATLCLAPRIALGATSQEFDVGSLIIPMDNCYQRDLAQNTTPKELGANPSAYCSGQAGSNGVLGNGARRAFGLVWLLLRAGIPLYQIVNPAKTSVDAPDLTIDTGTCQNGQHPNPVTLVDPSLPATYCGLDPLHAVSPKPNTPGVAACATSVLHPTVGTVELGPGPNTFTAVSYRGGPLVVDAKHAAVARDIMAWYFVQPNFTFPALSTIPYLNPTSLGTYGVTSEFVDPGHHPLHWSDYTPSEMIPFYPANAFNFEVGGHPMQVPCVDPSICPFTSWDPVNPNGYVHPSAPNFTNAPIQNGITFATVNVHQAQVAFFGYVGQVLSAPLAPIALAAITDPIHINTFRFYLEEAGLTFGPCATPPGPWLAQNKLTWKSPVSGTGDYFFDPDNYPFPWGGGGNPVLALGSPGSIALVPAACSEGLNTTDPTLFATYDSPDGGMAPNGGPFGLVLDHIAPEVAAFQSIVTTTASGQCGAPRYQEFWIPHWDAVSCSGPTTFNCAFAANCTPGVGSCVSTTGFDAYDPNLVQTVLNAAQVYVSNGGNLLAECLGAASLEDRTVQSELSQAHIDQTPGHFMTEWAVGAHINAYAPRFSFDFPPGAGLSVPSSPLLPGPGGIATSCINPGVASIAALPIVVPAPRAAGLPHAVGWPGATVSQTGPNGTVSLLPDILGRTGVYQFNSAGGKNPTNSPSRDQHMIYYAPPVTSGGGPATSLSDPFLQIGDFYFEGVAGATEGFYQDSAAGYAWTNANPDTRVLIRGYPANGLTPPAGPAGNGPDPLNPQVYSDYWLKNTNSKHVGAGTVVYLQGDSADGRPDELRMIWQAILNLNFVPSEIELARSSPATMVGPPPPLLPHHPQGISFLLQGTFSQTNLNSAKFSPFYNTVSDAAAWIFPLERGHLRQHDLGTGACIDATGVHNALAGCNSAVNGQGSNTTNFAGRDIIPGSFDFWDTSGPSPSDPALQTALMTNKLPGSTLGNRVIFTHMYQSVGGGMVGVTPIWMSSSNVARLGAGSGNLLCGLFPDSAVCGSPAYPPQVACPNGVSCLPGPLQCQACVVNPPGGFTAPVRGAADVAGLLDQVNKANGGCTPLLQDTCFLEGSPEVHCLDTCWSHCLDTCNPGTVYPPFPAVCGTCANDCANKCNDIKGNCGAGTALSAANFRDACFPSLGGIDHSTPVIVGPPPNSVSEVMKDAAATNATCRPTVAYVGATDGMLHAIYVDDPPAGCAICGNYVPGQEIWAFMPNNQLPIVHTNGDCSRALAVDGVPVVKDINVDLGDGLKWHTVLTMTEGQGGNHTFALDVTDPLWPVRSGGSCKPSSVNQASVSQAHVILWEQGEPLDPFEIRPFVTPAGGVTLTAFNNVNAYIEPGVEGPGFPAPISIAPTLGPTAFGTPTGGKYNHYLGKSASTFMGTLVGAGSHTELTFVAGQNGVDAQVDGFGRSISLVSNAACKKGNDALTTCGPAGEVVYAFDSGNGTVRSFQKTASASREVAHFTELYETGGNVPRSKGNNNIPAPVLGVSLGGQPTVELLVMPDLDGRVWGMFPSNLTSSQVTGPTSAPFPLFDIHDYRGCGGRLSPTCVWPNPAPVWSAQVQALVSSAPFANPAAFLAPGTCSTFTDPVVVLATGGTDWGPAASTIVALDLAANVLITDPVMAANNDSAFSPMPVQEPTRQIPLEVATCPSGVLPSNTASCVGRVFGQPLVVGQNVLFTASTGSLTGIGNDLDQQKGDGRIAALGTAGCGAIVGAGNCGICEVSESSFDLVTQVGKVASGLAATPPGAGKVTVLSASTTGIGAIQISSTSSAAPFNQRLALQQFWLRQQRR